MLSQIQVSLHPSLLFNGICILSFIIGIIKPINRHNKVIPSHKPERYNIIEVNDYADDDLTALGQKMREARKKKDLTQQELADLSHVSVKPIANIENP